MTIPLPRRRVKKSLKLSTLDGTAWSAMAGLTQNYITPFALALKASTVQIGLLASIPNLMMSLAQLASPGLTERIGSRKGLILPAVMGHALLWIPILLVPWLFPDPKTWWLIFLVTLSGIFGAVGNPAWGSMMADLVPMKIRGRYFSFRARAIGFVGLVSSFIAGGILELFSGNVFFGFAILFGGATAFRLLSYYFLSSMYEPEKTDDDSDTITIPAIVKKMGNSNLGKFTLYVALMSFGVNLAGPFFAVYMLQDLNFSYFIFTLSISANAVANMSFQTYWGRRADRFGNVKIMRITSFMMPIIPMLWLIWANPYYIMGVQVFAGITWSGFNLATSNFLYDASDSKNRSKYIAVFNATNGIAACAGALTGGFLAKYVPILFNFDLQTMFLMSGLVRGVVVVGMIRMIHEVRRVPKANLLHIIFSRTPNRRPTKKKIRLKFSPSAYPNDKPASRQ